MVQQTFQAQAYRVLVVDDNEINREVALAALEPYGCQLSQAESGAQAIQMVREQIFDMIFMDYLMPEMDGLETVERIRTLCGENGKKPVIAALTAEETPQLRERFRACGCQEVLAKPIDPGQLDQVLDRWVPQEMRQASAWTPPAGMTAEEIQSFQAEGIDLVGTGIAEGKTADQYRQLLRLYYMDGKKNLTAWKNMDAGRLEAYRIWVHGLKSASINIGAMEVSALAREQENAAKAGDLETVRARSPELFDRYGRLLEEISRVLKEPGQENAEALPALEASARRKRLLQALEMLEDFESKACAQAVEELLDYELPARIRETLEDVREKLQMYEDDEAEDLLRHLLEETGEDQTEQGAM
jgi:CheY-like chemotaxis protein